ncbi:BSD domain-containing protein 1-like [Ylistrum balloti]|uniref:BSD domain-containing protein 1-like n=1 Tax=Ylistrum balloti TaxID=509963 RepID=UPI002905F088|nr:BSD domain-containing protein 1-like [Ylistrum balloti]
MADGKDDGDNWWGSWLQAAKEKSASAIAMVKKDLADYTCTMQQDTSQVMAITTEKMKEMQAKEGAPRYGFASFLEDLTKSLVVEAEDKYDKPIPAPSTDPMFDRAKARLHAVQVDPGTYCNEPSGDPEVFKEWVKNFSMDEVKGDVSELLVSKVEVRALYTKLVPSEISHADFWQRYFYKVNQLHLDEARKLALMKRAERAEVKEDSISWDDSDDEDVRDNKEKIKGVHSPDNASTKERLAPTPDTLPEKQQKTQPELCTRTETSEEQTTPSVITNPSLQNIPTLNNETKIPTENKEVETRSIQKEEKCDKDSMVEKGTEADLKSEQILKVESDLKSEIEQIPTELVEENKTITDVNGSENITHGDRASLEICVKEKGDVVVVNPDRDSPSTESEGKKDAVSTDDDWEQDFDVELTEEDMKAADEIAKKLNLSATDYTKLTGDVGDDWESWE